MDRDVSKQEPLLPSDPVVRDAEEMEGLGPWSVPTAQVSLALQRKQEGFLSRDVVLRDGEALERDRFL